MATEITSGGLARAFAGGGSYSHTTGASSYTFAVTFTATTTFSAVQKAGLITSAYNATYPGILAFESTFTPVNLLSSDTMTITWTINI